MGRVFSKAARNWNVENRAAKEIAKEKPNVAPRHPSTSAKIETFAQDHPELLEAQRTKNEELHRMLHGMNVAPERLSEIRPKPQVKTKGRGIDAELGLYTGDVNKIPEGQCSLAQAFDMLSKHQANPKEYNVDNVVSDFRLDKETVEKVLKHFKVYEVQLPKGKRLQDLADVYALPSAAKNEGKSAEEPVPK